MAQEEPLRFAETLDERQAPYPKGNEGDYEEPDGKNKGESEEEL